MLGGPKKAVPIPSRDILRAIENVDESGVKRDNENRAIKTIDIPVVHKKREPVLSAIAPVNGEINMKKKGITRKKPALAVENPQGSVR